MGFSRALLPPLSSRAPPGTLRALRRARETCGPRVRKGADPAAAGGCRGRGTEQDRRRSGGSTRSTHARTTALSSGARALTTAGPGGPTAESGPAGGRGAETAGAARAGSAAAIAAVTETGRAQGPPAGTAAPGTGNAGRSPTRPSSEDQDPWSFLAPLLPSLRRTQPRRHRAGGPRITCLPS